MKLKDLKEEVCGEGTLYYFDVELPHKVGDKIKAVCEGGYDNHYTCMHCSNDCKGEYEKTLEVVSLEVINNILRVRCKDE